MPIEIEQFRCLETNIGLLFRDTESDEVAAVDAPDADAVRAALERRNWELRHIFVTHSHPDHIQGIDGLRRHYACRVVAPEKSRELVREADLWIDEGDVVRVGGTHFHVLATPGHCTDHVAYWAKALNIAFVGDVLFAVGCGRVFGGNYAAMYNSLQRVKAMPDETQVYFGHDYAVNNGRFALAAEPGNADLTARLKLVDETKKAGKLFSPVTLADEKRTNPFLRTDAPAVAAMVKLSPTDGEAVFRALRDWKDRF
ncbi:MAG: hydroxyacylglutathione hydrolase [Methylobacteriaceae bacterium]|jgi:hydroxyacylglutathione hydrolase|nr:hydroxyacylglutathione hydrolase [Methylobacteriaceae bacterium]